jgi:hypothetical protein
LGKVGARMSGAETAGAETTGAETSGAETSDAEGTAADSGCSGAAPVEGTFGPESCDSTESPPTAITPPKETPLKKPRNAPTLSLNPSATRCDPIWPNMALSPPASFHSL